MKNKKLINSIKKGYVKIPDKIFEMGLKPELIGVYCYLVKQSEEFNPSVRTIEKHLNVSRNTAGKYVQKLVDLNIIKLVKGHSVGKPAEYEFVKPNEWITREV